MKNKIRKKLLALLKYFFFIFFCSFLYLLLLLFSLKKLSLDILNNKPEKFQKNFLKWRVLTFWISPVKKINQILPDLVGKNSPKTYFILLQNNGELRPSGGFIGSYAKTEFIDGGLAGIEVQDIYVPDGQIPGHVDPPWPIQKAFKQGFWRLRDSNWKIDFPTAIKDIDWFFQKGKEKQADGFIAINLFVIKDILEIIGPIDLPDYQKTIDTDNLIDTLQFSVEKDFFPGSTQKKDILNSFAKKLFLKMKTSNTFQLIQLIKSVHKNLVENQILLYAKNQKLQSLFNKLNWDGEVERKKESSDFTYIVDSNLGSNKANFYVQREARQKIIVNGNQLKEKLEIEYQNQSQYQDPVIEKKFWGGNYKNFLRIILPLEAEVKEIKIDGKQLKDKKEVKKYQHKNLQSVGFFVDVPYLASKKVAIEYQLPIKDKKYSLEINKQPGIKFYQHTVFFEDKKFPLKINKNVFVQTTGF